MVRVIAVALIVLFAFVLLMLVLSSLRSNPAARDRAWAQKQYVKYVRKAQKAARKNRAEADLYATLADGFLKQAQGHIPDEQPDL